MSNDRTTERPGAIPLDRVLKQGGHAHSGATNPALLDAVLQSGAIVSIEMSAHSNYKVTVGFPPDVLRTGGTEYMSCMSTILSTATNHVCQMALEVLPRGCEG